MLDMPGDLEKRRKTLPLVHGENVARWAIAIPVLFWSFVFPGFWELGWVAYLFPVGLGGILAGRLLMLRSVDADRDTWRLWCVWTMSLYLLPLFKNYEVLLKFSEGQSMFA